VLSWTNGAVGKDNSLFLAHVIYSSLKMLHRHSNFFFAECVSILGNGRYSSTFFSLCLSTGKARRASGIGRWRRPPTRPRSPSTTSTRSPSTSSGSRPRTRWKTGLIRRRRRSKIGRSRLYLASFQSGLLFAGPHDTPHNYIDIQHDDTQHNTKKTQHIA